MPRVSSICWTFPINVCVFPAFVMPQVKSKADSRSLPLSKKEGNKPLARGAATVLYTCCCVIPVQRLAQIQTTLRRHYSLHEPPCTHWNSQEERPNRCRYLIRLCGRLNFDCTCICHILGGIGTDAKLASQLRTLSWCTLAFLSTHRERTSRLDCGKLRITMLSSRDESDRLRS